jgi:diketogulonate reductase-like aldo/keto reductase
VYAHQMAHFFQLSNGVQIPAVGLGTFRIRGEEAERVVKCAVEECGYKLIDTAGIYRNEAAIGKVLKELDCRQDIFLTSKLSPHHQGYKEALNAFQRSLNDLQVSYLDLYLIHWPGKSGQKVEDPNNKEAREASWKALVELYERGKIRAIGVSNYSIRHLEQHEDSKMPLPHVVQNEYHPLLAKDPVPEWCKSRGIVFQSYSTLGEGQLVKQVEQYPALKEMSEKYSVTTSQLLLRWSLQKGIPVVPKSTNGIHLKQNLDLYDFEIQADDVSSIDDLYSGHKFCWDSAKVY